jgi:hypothetical protein
MLHLIKKKLVGGLGMAKPWDEAMKKIVARLADKEGE